MSNHEMDLRIMTLMSDYVNNKKPFNYYELKGAVDILKHFYDAKHALNNEIISPYTADCLSPIEEINNTETPSQENSESEENDLRKEELSIQKTRRTRNVWSDVFCKEIKTELDNYFKKNTNVTKADVHDYFLKTFGKKLNDKDKICYSAKRPNWIDKLDDNINHWFVKTGICSFANGIYHYKPSSDVQSKLLEKSAEM